MVPGRTALQWPVLILEVAYVNEPLTYQTGRDEALCMAIQSVLEDFAG